MASHHRGMGLLIAALALGGAATAADAPIRALQQIEPGQWALREPGSSRVVRTMCITDPAVLMQFEHERPGCSRLVTTNEPMTATVHYRCPAAGEGHTTIRVASSESFHLETQGIAGGAPFDISYEARRTGACPAPPR